MGVGIKTRRYVIKLNEELIGENVSILIKFELSECRGVTNPFHIQTYKKFISRRYFST